MPVSERRYRIVVCRGPDCGDRRDSASVHAAFGRALAEAGLGARCELDWQSCFGRCSQGPNVLVREVVAAPIHRGLADLPRGLAAARAPRPRCIIASPQSTRPRSSPATSGAAPWFVT